MSYKLVNKVSKDTIKELKKILRKAVWEDIIGPIQDYKTWHGLNDALGDIQELTELWPLEKWKQTFFLKIPPGGNVNRHADQEKNCTSYHVPVTTNNKCESVIYNPDKQPYHLPVGGVYEINRTLEHESFNRGKTNRVHLIITIND